MSHGFHGEHLCVQSKKPSIHLEKAWRAGFMFTGTLLKVFFSLFSGAETDYEHKSRNMFSIYQGM